MRYAGDIRYNDVYGNISALIQLYGEQSVRRQMSDKMRQMVDGNGAVRVVKGICGK